MRVLERFNGRNGVLKTKKILTLKTKTLFPVESGRWREREGEREGSGFL